MDTTVDCACVQDKNIDETTSSNTSEEIRSKVTLFEYNFPEMKEKELEKASNYFDTFVKTFHSMKSMIPDNINMFNSETNNEQILEPMNITAHSEIRFQTDAKIIQNMLKEKEMPFILFIHGYNNTIEEIQERVCQMSHNIALDNQAIIASFNWPSESKLTGYEEDQDRVEMDFKYLYQFIKIIKQYNPNIKIDYVCHSMGNYLLFLFLKHIIHQQTYYLLKNSQIMSIAADVNWYDYCKTVNEIMGNPETYGVKSWTHYYNHFDNALTISSTLFVNGVARAGKFAIEIDDKIQNVYSIDCSKFRSFFFGIFSTNHSYIDECDVQNDLKQIILDQEIDPINRSCPAKIDCGEKSWRLV